MALALGTLGLLAGSPLLDRKTEGLRHKQQVCHTEVAEHSHPEVLCSLVEDKIPVESWQAVVAGHTSAGLALGYRILVRCTPAHSFVVEGQIAGRDSTGHTLQLEADRSCSLQGQRSEQMQGLMNEIPFPSTVLAHSNHSPQEFEPDQRASVPSCSSEEAAVDNRRHKTAEAGMHPSEDNYRQNSAAFAIG